MNDPLRYLKIFVALACLGLCFLLGNMAYTRLQDYIKNK